MVLVRLLERKDGASLIVAIASGVVVSQVVLSLANTLTSWVLDSAEVEFKDDIILPLVVLAVSALLLEGLARLVIAVRGATSK